MNRIKFISFAWALILVSCNSSENSPDAYGQFEATEIIISAQTQGSLLNWNVEEGKKYDSSAVLGYIDSTSLFLKKEQLKAQYKSISSKYTSITTQIDVLNEQKKNLLKEKDRFAKLVSENAATQKQLDDITNNIEVLNKQIENIKSQNLPVSSELEAMNFQIKQLEDQLSKCYVKMPINGTILEKYAEESEFVAPPKSLAKIANLENLILRAYIDEEQLSQIKLGQKVRVFVDNGGNLKEYPGVISWISSQSEFSPKIIQNRDERKNLMYAIKITVKNDGGLKIGMLGDVRFN
ncbi:MAG TPA: HlyD family efflux transporter periplasmic adaptor subunit [Bacteroidales bacterium]|nr:HlyD family efflux transporter periplasmic adaptor subunit [Bacteroidales bacterium]